MRQTTFKPDPRVSEILNSYPEKVREKLHQMRQMVIDVAESTELIDSLEETLKWREPSYLTKHGSTLRMDWKEKHPDQVCFYFQCSSSLVENFRKVFGSSLRFEGNRAIELDIENPLPELELKTCIKAALLYHKVKNLPLLGMDVG